MNNTQKHTIIALSAGVTAIVALSLSTGREAPVYYGALPVYSTQTWQVGAYLLPRVQSFPAASDRNSDRIRRVAKRMQMRLWTYLGTTPSISVLERALAQRRTLFQKKITITYDAAQQFDPATTDLHAHPLWMKLSFSYDALGYVLDEDRIQKDITQFGLPGVTPPSDVTFDTQGSLLAHGGYEYSVAAVTDDIIRAFHERDTDAVTLSVPLQYRDGHVFVRDEESGKKAVLTLLASGRSNFKGSPFGREFNIKKAIHEHLHNVIIPAGEEFSFNSILGGPVTLSRGWRESLGIFEGGELRPTPGGGICQVSTTLYRAIVLAGLPVLQRQAHSLYVSYYKEYGVGIDATIFPPYRDLVFLNDTGSDIVVQAEVLENDDVFVHLYGVSDGRVVELDGPFLSGNAPDDLQVNGRKLMKNEIAWVQRIQHADGSTEENIILSRYGKGIPQSQLLAELTNEEESVSIDLSFLTENL